MQVGIIQSSDVLNRRERQRKGELACCLSCGEDLLGIEGKEAKELLHKLEKGFSIVLVEGM